MVYKIGGLSAKPKNLDSFCGMFINLVFATSAQFAGAWLVQKPSYTLIISQRKRGDDYYLRSDEVISSSACKREKTIKGKFHQYFQQIVYFN